MRNRRDVVRGRLAALEAELAFLEKIPDDLDEGTVLRWHRVVDEKTYTYAALRAGDSWHVTGYGPMSERRVTMETLWQVHLMRAVPESVVVMKVDRTLLT